jgi:hypothetical protein
MTQIGKDQASSSVVPVQPVDAQPLGAAGTDGFNLSNAARGLVVGSLGGTVGASLFGMYMREQHPSVALPRMLVLAGLGAVGGGSIAGGIAGLHPGDRQLSATTPSARVRAKREIGNGMVFSGVCGVLAGVLVGRLCGLNIGGQVATAAIGGAALAAVTYASASESASEGASG